MTKVLSVSIHHLTRAADKDARQMLLSARVDTTTTYRDVYDQLWEDWQEEGQSPINSRTTDAEMDVLFRQELAALKRRDAALLDAPFHKSMGPSWQRSRVAFFSVTWVTDEDGWDTPPS